MGRRITRSFTVGGETGTIFDLTRNYLSTLNYSVVNAERPIHLEVRRGTTHGSYTSFHVDRWITTLRVYLSPGSEGVKVLFDYDISIPSTGILTRTDLEFIEDEFNNYRKFIQERQGQVRRAEASEHGERAAVEESRTFAAPEYVTELEHLARLRDRGIITAEDFDSKKRQLLNLEWTEKGLER